MGLSFVYTFAFLRSFEREHSDFDTTSLVFVIVGEFRVEALFGLEIYPVANPIAVESHVFLHSKSMFSTKRTKINVH